jgi:hypothetical protein
MECVVSGSPDDGEPVVLSAIDPDAEGEMVQDQGGYGLSGDLSPKVYFWIASKGDGQDGAKRRVSAVASAQY